MKYTLLWTAGQVTHKENTYDDGLVVQNIPVELLEHGTMFHLAWTEARIYMQCGEGEAPVNRYANNPQPKLGLSFKDFMSGARPSKPRPPTDYCKHGCSSNIWYSNCPEHGRGDCCD